MPKIILLILILMQPAALAEPVPQTGRKGKETQGQVNGGVAVTAAATAVRFNCQVRDAKGNLVTGLTAGNFRVLEDGQSQDILLFEPDTSPVSVALMVEFSRSTEAVLADIREGATDLLRGLRPDDYCALVVFNNRPRIYEDFTLDKDRVKEQVNALSATVFSGIELLTSLDFLVDRMETIPGKKGIVLLATGLTETGGNQKKLLQRLQNAAVPIYAVSIGQYARNALDPYLSESDHARFFQADHRLRLLAESSGGDVFYPRFATQFPGVLRTVLQDLHHQYLLAYAPPDPSDLRRKRRLNMEAVADINGDGIPEKLVVIHVMEYTLAARSTPQQ